MFPRGASSVCFDGVTRSSVTNNRLHSFYPGMVILRAGSSENLVASNHFLRDHEPWTPFLSVGQRAGRPQRMLCVSGSNNSIIGNHFSQIIDAQSIRPAGATPVVIRLTAGTGNFVSTNHVVAMDVHARSSDSCFAAQVDALLTTDAATRLDVTTVQVDPQSSANTILDSGGESQVVADRSANALRPTPAVGTPASPDAAAPARTGR